MNFAASPMNLEKVSCDAMARKKTKKKRKRRQKDRPLSRIRHSPEMRQNLKEGGIENPAAVKSPGSEKVDYSEIIKEIDQASGFDLYRLRAAIDRMLDDPKRIREVKRHIHPGEEVEYFEPLENRVIKARLLKFQRTQVIVETLQDQKQWSIPYFALNIHRQDVTIEGKTQEGLGRNEVSVEDCVGFIDRDGYERSGKVIRLNQKTVTLECEKGMWRVAYELLFKDAD